MVACDRQSERCRPSKIDFAILLRLGTAPNLQNLSYLPSLSLLTIMYFILCSDRENKIHRGREEISLQLSEVFLAAARGWIQSRPTTRDGAGRLHGKRLATGGPSAR